MTHLQGLAVLEAEGSQRIADDYTQVCALLKSCANASCISPAHSNNVTVTFSAQRGKVIQEGERGEEGVYAGLSSGVVTKGCPHMLGHARFSTTLLCFITGQDYIFLLAQGKRLLTNIAART